MRKKSELHGYQNDTITEFYESDELLAILPMGGGKTVSALTGFHELRRDGHVRQGIVLAPKRVASDVWPPEVDEWEHLQDLNVVLVVGTPDQRAKKLNGPGDLFIVGIDNTQWLTEQMAGWDDDDPRLDLLIIDELSRYKAATGKRARALVFVADRFKIRWGLTGTPRPNNELDLYMPARIISRKRVWGEAWLNWREKYFMPEDPYTRLRWNIREEWKEKIHTDVAKFSYTVPPEALPPQPELVPIIHKVELPQNAKDAFKDMMKNLILETSDGEMVEAINRAVASGKLDQIAQGFIYRDGETMEILHDAKKQKLDELLQGLGGQQAMITYWFREDLNAIRGLLGDRVPILGSITSPERAAQAIKRWNAGEAQYIAVHPASAGHGLNLQKSCAGQIIHYCPTWSAELFDQVNARVSRQGNTQERVLNHLIVAEGTFDMVKVERVRTNQEGQREFIEFVKGWREANG